MTEIEIVKNKLIDLGYPVIKTIDSDTIHYTDNESNEYTIHYEINTVDIHIKDNKIGWFASTNDDTCRVVIIEEDNLFEWEPVGRDMCGCFALLVEWVDDHLIVIYSEESDIFIASIKDKKVNYFNFHGYEIERKKNIISFDTCMDRTVEKGYVRLLKIPELIALPSISIKEATKEKLIPLGINMHPTGHLDNLSRKRYKNEH